MITTADCEFEPKSRRLSLSSHHLPDGRFPKSLQIKSEHTGRTLTFVPIGPDHPNYDEDGWDGEIAIYEPTERCNVFILSIYHGQ